MRQHLAAIAVLVPDYAEAIAYYTGKLGFELIEDTALSAGKRWVLVAPRGDGGTRLLLAKATNPAQTAAIGNQAGGRVLFFLHTDDFDRDYARYRQAGIDFTEQPRDEAYGKVVVFRDAYGNKRDLVGKPAAGG
jgi:catechol 2,3-dioxygenase-like lactoylglutathione lyase family enzyme